MVERTVPSCCPCGKSDMGCCIGVNKIFDSARDKDCLEDLKVYLCDCGQEVLDHSNAVRCRNVEIADTSISLESVPFNKGFYQVNVRYYFCITLECCLCNGRSQEIKGLAAFDKKIILFGSEKNVTVFTSDPEKNSFCPQPKDLSCKQEPTLPTVVVEAAQPICLDLKVLERCRPFGNSCITVESIPEGIRNGFEGNFIDNAGLKSCFVTIGMFSMIRIQRPVQIMLPNCNYCIPEKESTPCGNADPCSAFGKMTFPVGEFYPMSE